MSDKEREYNLKKMQEEAQTKKMKAMEETLKRQNEIKDKFKNPKNEEQEAGYPKKKKKKLPMPEEKKTVDLNVNADIKEDGESTKS